MLSAVVTIEVSYRDPVRLVTTVDWSAAFVVPVLTDDRSESLLLLRFSDATNFFDAALLDVCCELWGMLGRPRDEEERGCVLAEAEPVPALLQLVRGRREEVALALSSG
eukprot:Sspe_Gene.59993::Locus_33011_Transcript_1_1_Confidence_1.000_Length_714::g.59993::m.59993